MRRWPPWSSRPSASSRPIKPDRESAFRGRVGRQPAHAGLCVPITGTHCRAALNLAPIAAHLPEGTEEAVAPLVEGLAVARIARAPAFIESAGGVNPIRLREGVEEFPQPGHERAANSEGAEGCERHNVAVEFTGPIDQSITAGIANENVTASAAVGAGLLLRQEPVAFAGLTVDTPFYNFMLGAGMIIVCARENVAAPPR